MTRPARPVGDAWARQPHLDDWHTFLQAHALLSRRLDEELRAEQAMSLAEYDALVQLSAAPDRRLRMSQLADSVLLSRSGVTRLVDRLAVSGLVERLPCATDARGAEAVLTERGLDRLRTASRTHLRGVSRYFLRPLTGEELSALGRSLGTIVGILHPNRSGGSGAGDLGDDAGLIGAGSDSEAEPEAATA